MSSIAALEARVNLLENIIVKSYTPSPHVYDVKSAAKELKISEAQVYYHAKKGQIKHFKRGGKILFTLQHLNDWQGGRSK